MALLAPRSKKSEELKRLSCYVFVLMALLTIPVYLTGEGAEEIVEHLPGVPHELIEEHEESALGSLIAIRTRIFLPLAIFGVCWSLDRALSSIDRQADSVDIGILRRFGQAVNRFGTPG